jgi:predicted PurR-regulated permease PerM
MKKEKLDQVVHLANLASVIVVSISVIAIISAGVFFFYPKDETAINVKVNYTISIDTTNVKDGKLILKANSEKINQLKENNKLVYKNINKLIEDFEKKHKNNIQSSKNQTDFTSYASAIFALIVSIAGFFGFKSINEMKLAAIEAAIEESNKVSENSMKNFMENELKEVTKKAVADVSMTFIEPLESKLNEIQDKMEECCGERDNVVVEPIINVEDENEPFNDNQV